MCAGGPFQAPFETELLPSATQLLIPVWPKGILPVSPPVFGWMQW